MNSEHSNNSECKQKTDIGTWFMTYNNEKMWSDNFGSGNPINYRALISENPNVLTFLDGCWSFITDCGVLFFAVVSTPATLIAQIIYVPDALLQIITMGMTVITAFTLIQLLTGRWFSFVE